MYSLKIETEPQLTNSKFLLQRHLVGLHFADFQSREFFSEIPATNSFAKSEANRPARDRDSIILSNIPFPQSTPQKQKTSLTRL